MEHVDRLLLYRLRVVGVALTANVGAIVALLLYRVLPGHQHVPIGPYLTILAIASIGSIFIARLPWKRMFESAAGMRMLYVWSAFDILLITALCVLARQPRPDFLWLYFLTTVFFAASYPVRGQIALLLFTLASALVGHRLAGQTIEPAVVVYGFACLVLTTFMAGFISHELRRELDETKRAGAEAQDRAQRLAELDRLKDDFVATASHELRTPVSVLVGMLDSMQRLDGRVDAETRREFLDRSLERARGLGQLIEDLLAVTRVEDGQMKLALERTTLAPLVARAVENAGVADVVHVTCSPDLSAVCDGLRISRVLTNLLDNAKKYSPAGSKITVDVAARDGAIEMRVGDAGPGIPEAEQSRVFDRLGRLSTAGGVSGFGLGLYIAKVIVEAHHGSVTVGQSALGGAEFVITLPDAHAFGVTTLEGTRAS